MLGSKTHLRLVPLSNFLKTKGAKKRGEEPPCFIHKEWNANVHKWILKEHKYCFEINYTSPIVLKNGRLRPISRCLLCLIFDCVSDVSAREVCTCKKKRLWTDCKHSANTPSGMWVVSYPSTREPWWYLLCLWLLLINKCKQFLSNLCCNLCMTIKDNLWWGCAVVCLHLLCCRINSWRVMLFDN